MFFIISISSEKATSFWYYLKLDKRGDVTLSEDRARDMITS
jgi:hypothetical protein